MEDAASLRLLTAARDVPWDSLDTEQAVFDFLWSYWGAQRGPLTHAATARRLTEPGPRLRVLHW